MRLINLFRYLLSPFSFIYFAAVYLRNIFYRLGIFKERALKAGVISIGNVTWGGTGKTTLVAYIAQAFLKKGRKVAVLIRGYGNDEGRLLSKLVPAVPVFVGKDRVKSGKDAIARHSVDTLLLDDGFQHRRLKRDLDIVCIDAVNPFGNGWVIPVGSMREGFNSLKRADIFLITKADLAQDNKAIEVLEDKLKRLNPDALIAKSIHKAGHFYNLSDKKPIDIEPLKDKEFVLVSAIGSPYSFEKTVLKLGLKVKRHFIFRDHHWYKDRDLKRVRDYCRKNNIYAAITTEKDAIRLASQDMMVLRIELEIVENEERFFDRLFGIRNS